MGVERFELDKYGADFNFVSKRVSENARKLRISNIVLAISLDLKVKPPPFPLGSGILPRKP